jgi:hypothetical protein
LKYLCRVEDASPLKGAASDGGDIGATILNRYGVSGTLWGEPGYDSLTQESLWPFPNEDVIKAKMSSWIGQNEAKRGFCVDSIGLYGGPVTLTSYIWEYLGYPCPSEFVDTANITEDIPDFINIYIDPNPFRKNTTIEFNLAAPAEVSIKILNTMGSKISSINLGRIQENPYSYELDMSKYPSGIYFLKVQTNTTQKTVKIQILK